MLSIQINSNGICQFCESACQSSRQGFLTLSNVGNPSEGNKYSMDPAVLTSIIFCYNTVLIYANIKLVESPQSYSPFVPLKQK